MKAGIGGGEGEGERIRKLIGGHENGDVYDGSKAIRVKKMRTVRKHMASYAYRSLYTMLLLARYI